MLRALWSTWSDKLVSKQVAVPSVGDSLRGLRGQLFHALAHKDFQGAVTALEQLEELEPGMPRWPHKRGDVLMQLSRSEHAFGAYAKAVRLYAETGKANLANAMAKTALIACPRGIAALNELDLETQEAFQRVSSPATHTMEIDLESVRLAAASLSMRP